MYRIIEKHSRAVENHLLDYFASRDKIEVTCDRYILKYTLEDFLENAQKIKRIYNMSRDRAEAICLKFFQCLIFEICPPIEYLWEFNTCLQFKRTHEISDFESLKNKNWILHEDDSIVIYYKKWSA